MNDSTKPPNHNTRYGIAAGVIALLLAVAACAGSWFLVQNPVLAQTLRDVVIIWLAGIGLLIGLVLVVLVILLAVLIYMLQTKIEPILERTNQTLHTVQGTTQFVSQNVAKPVIRVQTALAGARQVAKTISLIFPSRK